MKFLPLVFLSLATAACAVNPTPQIDIPPPPQQAVQTPSHGCAIFGGDLRGQCQSYPAWTEGRWPTPAGVDTLHILVVGGGGGGSANLPDGKGGPGGGSGKVISAIATSTGQPIYIQVGHKGFGGKSFMQPGGPGGQSSFADFIAQGGTGGLPMMGGTSRGPGGNNGGGGAGGGYYQINAHAGSGGDGGTGGANGNDGEDGTDSPKAVAGSKGGPGVPFPTFSFNFVSVGNGSGGAGGAGGHDKSGGAGFDGGGGGGGGGVTLNNTGIKADAGSTVPYPCACGVRGQSGDGGLGYGAGGGGSGNGMYAPGGDGASGVVYVEW